MVEISVVLIEDHNLTQVGLRTALQQQQNIRVVGEAKNAAQGLELLEFFLPNVAIVDIGLPDMDGIELIRRFKQFQAENQNFSTKILILTMHDEEESVLAAFGAGADSYCMKDIGMGKLTEAVLATYSGNAWIDPAIANIVLRKVRQGSIHTNNHTSSHSNNHLQEAADPPTKTDAATSAEGHLKPTPGESLTDRELEVLELIVNGYSNAAIAEKLFITIGTVKTHVRNILNKLCADDRTQAAVHALRSGIVG